MNFTMNSYSNYTILNIAIKKISIGSNKEFPNNQIF